jgi:ADP-heptose:LPS heptosyltransferase
VSVAEGPLPVPPFTPDGLIGVPLPAGAEPERVVVVRFHAFGDTAITFPLLAALRKRFPTVRLDVVTDVRSEALFRAHRDVDDVFAFDTRQGRFRKGTSLLLLALSARRRAVPVVLDLQRNRWSAFLIRLLAPGAWVGFDRHAPRTALSRYLEAAEELGLGRLAPVFAPHAREPLLEAAGKRLVAEGWDGAAPLVCLNPAGGWATKQWSIERYVELGLRLQAEGCCLVALAAAPAPPRFATLKEGLGSLLIDLTGRTSPGEAVALVALCSLAVSDDSGLMHLAWTQGVPTLALFGASRSAWSRPEGRRAGGFYSEDLPCGACLSPACARSDVFCLARVGVDDVLARAHALLAPPAEHVRSSPGAGNIIPR